MSPGIINYQHKYQTRGRWIFIPNAQCERRAEQVLSFFERSVEFPEYFYHYRSGGHVAALHEHRKNDFFFKIDIQNFFYSIARNRVHRALASYGMGGAPTYAKWSTVRSPYQDGPRYVLPIGFRQSPHLASLVLMQSPVFAVMEAARAAGVYISVYLDDIIGSGSSKLILDDAYESIRRACIEANLLPNVFKLAPPSEAIVAFNCNLRNGLTVVTDERIALFYEKDPNDFARKAFEAYVNRVAQ